MALPPRIRSISSVRSIVDRRRAAGEAVTAERDPGATPVRHVETRLPTPGAADAGIPRSHAGTACWL